MKPAGEFDSDYRKKIQDACLKAVLEASIHPATNTAILRNAQISKGLLRISATLVATSNQASSVSPTLGTQSAIPYSNSKQKSGKRPIRVSSVHLMPDSNLSRHREDLRT